MLATVLNDPAWQTAIATWAIVAVTAAAAIVGGYAALTAARAFRLESQPVLVVRQLDREERAPIEESRLLRVFVVTVKGETVYDGIELREEIEADRRAHQGGQIEVEFRNVGRSPAIAVRVPFTVETPIMREPLDVDWESGGIPTSPSVTTQKGYGEVALDAIPAQASLYVVLTTTILNVVTLRVGDGVHTEILGNSRRATRLPVVATAPLQISAP